MNKEEFRKEFEKNVDYMMRAIPPDDIYLFAEQTFMASMYFLLKWSECKDLKEEAATCEASKKWITNILGYHHCKENNLEINLNLDLESMEDDKLD